MRKTILTLLLIVASSCFVSAQDLIVLKDAQEIEAKVEAVTQTEISYRKWGNPEGPLYTISKSDVFFIKYQNGEKEVISEQSAVQQSNAGRAAVVSNAGTSASAAEGTYSSRLNPRRAGRVTFDGYFNFTGIGSSYMAGPGIDLSLGVNLFDYAYVGLQTGFDVFFPLNMDADEIGWIVPIGVNMRSYIPCNGRIYPFFDWTIGAGVHNGAGFHNAMLVGCDFSRFSLGLGWDYLAGLHSGVLKLGIRLGKIK